jgi:hypothetical protein
MSSIGPAKSQHGTLYISSGGDTSIDSSGVWYQLNGTATYAAGRLFNFTHSDGYLTYTGNAIKDFVLSATISSGASAADLYHFAFAKNGTLIAASQVDRRIEAGLTHGNMGLHWIEELRQNDDITIVVTSTVQNSVTLEVDHTILTINSL